MLELTCIGIFIALSGTTVWLIGALDRMMGGGIMNAIYIVSGIVAVGLLFYLLVALLKPEKF